MAANDNSGASVSFAGDVNGDGIDDVIIGAALADSNAINNAGQSYVVFGGSTVGSSGVVNLSSLTGSNGLLLNGIGASDYAGRSVSTAGDINGDGLDDLLIGANGADPNGNLGAGESYVVFMPLPDTAEPNCEPGDATPINLIQTLSSSIAAVGDLDRFVFTLTRFLASN